MGRKRAALFIGFFWFLTWNLELGTLNAGAAERKIVMYHTNDIHGYISAREAAFYKENPKRLIGGFAALAALAKTEKDPVLFLDSGDLFFASPEGNLTRGESVRVLAGAVGFTASAIGNHEYDFGEERIIELSKKAKFPLLSANIERKHPLKGQPAIPEYITPYIVREAAGIKVCILGLITPKTPQVAYPTYVAHLKFLDPIQTARRYSKELERQGCELTVALTHLGWAKDGEDFNDEKRLAHEVPGLDVVLGGHSHTRVEKAYQDPDTKTIAIQSGSYLTAVGRLALWVDAHGRVTRYEHNLRSLWIDEVGEDPAILELMKPFKAQVDQELSIIIATASVDMKDRYDGESVLGNFVADSIREVAKADIAMTNSGGIRSWIPAGPVTLRQIYTVLPFDNTVVTMNLTGRQIWDTLEHGFAGGRGVLQVSGLMVRYDPGRPAGSRLIEVALTNGPLDMNVSYRVATINFLADGGEGYSTFFQGRDRQDTGILQRDAMRQVLSQKSPAAPVIEGRIKKVILNE
ncbi:MAG: 5'-nucleotidase C-terminal domain-containing protein [Elusimicrobia bacterium]|nr:5'-nucleotidase C-terminal domain-containing protein [Elusimicrobiota bacterium]